MDHGKSGGAEHEVPQGLRTTAAWTWRLLLLAVAGYVVLRVLGTFQVLVVPVLVALLVVALVRPVYEALSRLPGSRRTPRSLAALVTIVLTLAVLGGLLTLIGQQIAVGFPGLREDAGEGLKELQRTLADSPLHLSTDQFSEWVDRASAEIRQNSDRLVSGALRVTSTAERVATGFFLVLFCSYFFLSGGDRIWAWLVGLFPATVRPRMDGAARRAWATLTAYVRATMVVALVDGIGVGVVATVLGLPLALPLGVLVFIGAFVPIVGALVSGSVAVLVAFVAKGTVAAVLMLAGVVAVQQIEAHVLQPFLLGRAVRVHPLGVILAITAGIIIAGVVGALFAVPIVAVANVVIEYLAGGDAQPESPTGVEAAGPLADEPQPQSGSGPQTEAEPDAGREAQSEREAHSEREAQSEREPEPGEPATTPP